MTPLKTYRHDLAAHLAAGLGTAATPLGAQVNPPATIVNPGTEYVIALDYCTDNVTFQVAIVGRSGDPAAVMDALDDLVDQVRATLATASPGGNRYRFLGVSGLTSYGGDDKGWPAVIATVGLERHID